jgi:ABC-type branched-subunit amino acid transport system ATPase component
VNPVLETEGLGVAYGGLRALDDVALCVHPGEIVGLIGPNGAGKTTCIDAIGGFVRAEGRVRIAGHDASSAAPDARARLGLSRTWQGADLFEDLSVRENLNVARGAFSLRRLGRQILTGRASPDPHVDEVLADLGIRHLGGKRPDVLTQGQRKLVGVARALAVGPKVICLDEPAAGLDGRESRDLGRRLRQIAKSGTGLLLVDHDMGLVLDVCHTIVVVDFGRVIASGPPDSVQRDPRVITAYLGGASSDPLTAEVSEELATSADGRTAP